MDHSGMHHGGMDHGHMDHGGMDMGGDQCSMNMIFTWSSKNLCIIFRQWRITSDFSLILSLLAIVLLTAGYELIRSASRQYEMDHKQRMDAFNSGSSTPPRNRNESSFLIVGRDTKMTAERKGKMVMGLLYAIQVFYSFFIMLLFMTYNGFVMLAVAVGAFVGYMAFSSDTGATKSVACH